MNKKVNYFAFYNSTTPQKDCGKFFNKKYKKDLIFFQHGAIILKH